MQGFVFHPSDYKQAHQGIDERFSAHTPEPGHPLKLARKPLHDYDNETD